MMWPTLFFIFSLEQSIDRLSSYNCVFYIEFGVALSIEKMAVCLANQCVCNLRVLHATMAAGPIRRVNTRGLTVGYEDLEQLVMLYDNVSDRQSHSHSSLRQGDF